MTGRRLYDIFVDAHRAEIGTWTYGAPDEGVTTQGPRVAWPYLHQHERDMWNAMARRIKGVKR